MSAPAVCPKFDFVFYSEEFPDWVGGRYNDVFFAELGVTPFSSQIVISHTAKKVTVSSPANFARGSDGEVISVNGVFGFEIFN